jgi:hypothetical protein
VKKVARETLGCERLELFSFHSTSKGLIGECGRRGGYMEVRWGCGRAEQHTRGSMMTYKKASVVGYNASGRIGNLRYAQTPES